MKDGTQLDTEMLEMLGELGLTEYEARIYCALVARSPMAASDISTESGVPMSKIYSVLDRLETGGWISVVPERPKKYRAVDPKLSIDQAYDRAVGRLDRSKSKLADSLSGLYEKSSGAIETAEFQIIHGDINILNHFKTLAYSPKAGIAVMMAFVSPRTAERVKNILKDSPGVKRILLIGEASDAGKFEEVFADTPDVVIYGVDHKWLESIVVVFTEDEGMYFSADGDELKMALAIRDKRILELVKRYVQYMHPEMDLAFGR